MTINNLLLKQRDYRGVPIYRTPLRYCESPLLAPIWGVRVIGTRRYVRGTCTIICQSTIPIFK